MPNDDSKCIKGKYVHRVCRCKRCTKERRNKSNQKTKLPSNTKSSDLGYG